MCRQFIREFCEVRASLLATSPFAIPSVGADCVQLSMPILMYDKDGKSTVMTLEKLLPMSFGPEKLGTTEDGAAGVSQ